MNSRIKKEQNDHCEVPRNTEVEKEGSNNNDSSNDENQMSIDRTKYHELLLSAVEKERERSRNKQLEEENKKYLRDMENLVQENLKIREENQKKEKEFEEFLKEQEAKNKSVSSSSSSIEDQSKILTNQLEVRIEKLWKDRFEKLEVGFEQKLKESTQSFITSEHQKIQTLMKEVEATKKCDKGRITGLEKQVEKLKAKRDEDKSSHKKIKEKLKETEKKVDKYEKSIAALEKKVEKMNDSVQDLRREKALLNQSKSTPLSSSEPTIKMEDNVSFSNEPHSPIQQSISTSSSASKAAESMENSNSFRNEHSDFSLKDLRAETSLDVHTTEINHIALTRSEGAEILVTASGKIIKATRIHDKKVLAMLSSHTSHVTCLTIINNTPQQKVLASACKDNNLVFTCLKSFTTINSFICSSPICKMQFRRRCNILVCGLACGRIDTWYVKVNSQRKVSSLYGEKIQPIGFELFSAKKKLYLAVANDISTDIDVWCLEDDQREFITHLSVECRKISSLGVFYCNKSYGNLMAVGTDIGCDVYKTTDYSIVYRLRSDQHVLESNQSFPEYLPLNNHFELISHVANSNCIHIWDIQGSRPIRTITTSKKVTCLFQKYDQYDQVIKLIAGNSCGKVTIWIAEKYENNDEGSSTNSLPQKATSITKPLLASKTVMEDINSFVSESSDFSLRDLREQTVLDLHTSEINHICHTNIHGTQMLITASGKIIKVTRIHDKKVLALLSSHTSHVTCLTVLRSKKILASACSGKNLTFTCLRSFNVINSFVFSSPIYKMVVYALDNKHDLVCGLACGRIEIWDMMLQKKVSSLHGKKKQPIGFELFSVKKEFYLAVVNSTCTDIDVWSLDDDQKNSVTSFSVDCSEIFSLYTFSYKGNIFMAVGTNLGCDIYSMDDRSVVCRLNSDQHPLEANRGYTKYIAAKDCFEVISHVFNSKSIHIWDIESKNLTRTINTGEKLTCLITSWMKNEKQNLLIAGNSRGKAIIWMIEKSKESKKRYPNNSTNTNRIAKRIKFE